MRRRLVIPVLLALLATALFLGAQSGDAAPPPRAPKGFFGIDPQSVLTDADAEYMKAGGIETVRWPLIWAAVQPKAKGGYDWSSFDPIVSVAARHGLKVLPFVVATPRWVAAKSTTLPINNGRARQAWAAFLKAAVARYGPQGEFWTLHASETPNYEPPVPRAPIRSWQVWNEANFFYFAYPVSPQRYARLLKISSLAIKAADPAAKVILTGLFGEPKPKGARGMPAAQFLEDLYKVRGIQAYFDGVALHPYAIDTEDLEGLVEALHEVTVENRDRVPLYITEMGWGSQNDFNQVAFEQGIQGQVRELRGAYGYLLENRRRLDVKQVYWYAWKDLKDSCSFCDSVGLFREGPRFHAKPAWRAFVSITHGHPRP
jgi:hypothetical protein